jgi:hypothetical protein
MDMDVGHGLSDPGPVALSPYAAAVVADAPSHYWRLNETASTSANDFVGSAPGAISGGVTLGQSPAVSAGASMTFDGLTGMITIAAPIDFTPPVTFEAWVKTSTVAGAHPIVGRDSGTIGLAVYLGVVSGKSYFYWGDPSGVQLFGTRDLANNQWHHVVAVATPTALTVYVDGVLDATLPSTILPKLGVLLAFGFDRPNLQYINGGLDELAIYPRALTTTQIANHYALRDAPFLSTGSDPTMMLCYSKDGGRSYGKELWRSAGKQGQTQIQVAWNRLGTVKDRVFRLVVTDPVPWRIVGAWLELEGS